MTLRACCAACVLAAALALPAAPAAEALDEEEEAGAAEIEPVPTEMTDPLLCMALAMYWEAKSEGEEGKRAVGWVILNRVASESLPDDVCAVVTDGGETPPCQFSFWCDGLQDQPVEPEPWDLATTVAADMLAEPGADPTEGALYFHAEHVEPDWAAELEHTVQIGAHLYYR